MDEAAARLQDLGFTDHEARAYAALVRRGPATGYELAKASGLPRPNVYAVLQRLEERGAALRVEGEGAARYEAVPPGELLARVRERLDDQLAGAQRALAGLATPPERETLWTSRGYPALLQHSRSVIESAERRLLVALWAPEAQALARALEQATARGVQVTTLCLQGCAVPCPGCRGAIYRHQVAPTTDPRWLVVAADDHEVLAGEIGPGDDALAVRSRQRLLVELAAWYVRHTIALATIAERAGDDLARLLPADTRDALAALVPNGGDLMEYVRRLVGRRLGGEGDS